MIIKGIFNHCAPTQRLLFGTVRLVWHSAHVPILTHCTIFYFFSNKLYLDVTQMFDKGKLLATPCKAVHGFALKHSVLFFSTHHCNGKVLNGAETDILP